MPSPVTVVEAVSRTGGKFLNLTVSTEVFNSRTAPSNQLISLIIKQISTASRNGVWAPTPVTPLSSSWKRTKNIQTFTPKLALQT
jgi:hypothetical protein